MPFTRLLGTTLILCGLTALMANSAGAAGFRQVGWLRSDTRNLAVGNGEVRVVSRPDTESLDLSGDIREDRPKIERLYPGWDLLSDLVILYRATPDGFIQDSFYYESGVDRKPFPGDPIEPNLSVFDATGERRANVPESVRAQVGSAAQVVAAASANWDDDSEEEWVVVIAGTWDVDQAAAPMRITLLDRSGTTWTVNRTFEIKEKVRAGPLEIRDVTGDGQPDIVFRCFHTSLGHFWVDAHIYSQHKAMPVRSLPAPLLPASSAEVVDLR